MAELWSLGHLSAPSSRTLVVVALLSLLGTAFFPPPEPHHVPVIGADGHILTRPDGSPMTHIAPPAWDAEQIVFFVLFVLFIICSIWLLVRFLQFLYDKWRYGRRVASYEGSTGKS